MAFFYLVCGALPILLFAGTCRSPINERSPVPIYDDSYESEEGGRQGGDGPNSRRSCEKRIAAVSRDCPLWNWYYRSCRAGRLGGVARRLMAMSMCDFDCAAARTYSLMMIARSRRRAPASSLRDAFSTSSARGCTGTSSKRPGARVWATPRSEQSLVTRKSLCGGSWSCPSRASAS